MEIKIFWNKKLSKELYNNVLLVLEELWLSDFIKIKITTDINLKKELNIKKEPALIVEEESIDFKDIIFEWIMPEDDELKSMFISIIWWEWPSGCAPEMCASWCSMC
jgi:hypothetical protein